MTMKKILLYIILILSVIGLIACKGGEENPVNTSDNEDERYVFNAEYQADYGEVYYFEKAVLNDLALEYEVKNGGNPVPVCNYGFMVSSMDDYDVVVKYKERNSVLASFKVVVEEKVAPNIALSYYRKFVLPGTMVELPDVSVSDNRDLKLNYTAILSNGGNEVSYSGDKFEAVSGEYEYIVKSTDSSGNTAEKKCVITVGGELEMAKCVNWSDPNDNIEYCREISGGTMETSNEIVYGGFESSFKVTITEPIATTCITVKNALIEDISEYDYFLVYMYNDMSNVRQCSVNWSSKHINVLNQGEWVPIIFPINENLVTDSNNSIYREQQDWKNCNGLRFYIQNTSTAFGSIYLTDIFLFDIPEETEFLDNVAALEALTEADGWGSVYNLVNAEYNVLKAAGVEADLNSAIGRINAKYSQLVLCENYENNTLAYADEKLNISQIVANGDVWSLPAKVSKTTEVKYGDEKGSFEVTFRLDRNRANTKLINPSIYGKAPAGEVVFMVKNATNSELKLYNDETAKTGLWPIEVSHEWQEVRLAVDSSTPLETLKLYLYTMDEQLVKPLDDGTAKVYYSNIRFVPYEEAGEYLVMNENYVNTFTEKWAGSEEISFVNEADKQYNDNGVMSVNVSDPLKGGRYGFYLNRNKLSALLEKGSVKLTVTYNVSNVSYIGKYIGFYGMQTVVADKGEGWHEVSTIFTAMPQHFIFGIGSKGDFAWDGYGISGEMLIARITYEYAEPPKFSVAASTTAWQNPEMVMTTEEYVYGEESESYKVGFKIGYKYGNLTVLPYIDVESGYIEFYFKNMTGKALEIYTEESLAENGGTTSISASTEWQLIRLAINPAVDAYDVKVRGAGESVVNENEVVYYYISTINVG